jgi:hypothetical protein
MNANGQTGPNHAPSASAPAPPPKPAMKKRWMIAILAVTFLFVLMPFLFWRMTWFGRPLSVDQLGASLADTSNPREIQHALSQLADRMLSSDEATRASARRFYPAVERVAESTLPELRLTAAWVMGQDNSVPEFHQELLRLLQDPNPMVCRNSALALVRFSDTSGRDEILGLLSPYSMPAPYSGTLTTRLKPDEAINPGTLLGHIDTRRAPQAADSQGSSVPAPAGNAEFRSNIPGTINRWLAPDGSVVTAGQPVLLVDPSSEEVYEALRALYLIGRQQDLPAVEQFVHGGDRVPANVRQQAEMTAEAIRARH